MKPYEDLLVRLAEAKHFRSLTAWSYYISGARDMALRMREHFLTQESHHSTGKITKDDLVINKAIIDLILSSKKNTDRFLMEQYEIRLTDHVKDKKGKLVKCRAYFAKKVVKYEEV